MLHRPATCRRRFGLLVCLTQLPARADSYPGVTPLLITRRSFRTNPANLSLSTLRSVCVSVCPPWLSAVT